jgi:hypothetical protein
VPILFTNQFWAKIFLVQKKKRVAQTEKARKVALQRRKEKQKLRQMQAEAERARLAEKLKQVEQTREAEEVDLQQLEVLNLPEVKKPLRQISAMEPTKIPDQEEQELEAEPLSKLGQQMQLGYD